MTAAPRPPAPRHVPTLTEVLDAPGHAPAAVSSAAPADDPEQAELVRRVLVGLHQRLDATLEPRLRAAVAPAVEAIASALVAEARAQLGDVLREAVREAVEQELALRRRRDKPPR